MTQAFGGVGFGPMEDQVRRNMQMFERTFAMFAPFARRETQQATADAAAAAEKPQSASGEIDELKRQMEEMQKRINRLGEGEK
jgi:polyhydroxyalkanoate synthesis regulator protein